MSHRVGDNAVNTALLAQLVDAIDGTHEASGNLPGCGSYDNRRRRVSKGGAKARSKDASHGTHLRHSECDERSVTVFAGKLD
jgi:hypothetical protein